MRTRRLCALLLACVLLLTGCAGFAQTDTAPDDTADPTGPAGPVQQVPDAAPLSYGFAYSATAGWNPYTCMEQENRTIFPLLYEGLFEIAPDFTATPVLCRSYTMSDDEKTYVFTLDPDARFTDGSLLTTADVIASYACAEEGGYYESRFDHIVSYEATDLHTLTVTLDTACGDLPLLLDIPIVKAGTQLRLRPTGSGAYTVQNAPVRLAPAASHWRGAGLLFDGETISLTVTASESDVRDAFELRDISLVCTDPTAGTACVYHSDYELWTCPTTVMVYLGFNLDSSLFSDAAVRAGITHLIDRDTIISQEFGGFAVAATLPASPLAPCYDRSLAVRYGYDPDAFDLEVTQTEDATLIVNAGDTARVNAAKRIVAALAEAGIHLTVSALPPEQYEEALLYGNYDCYLGEIRLTADFNLEQFFRLYGSARFGIHGHEEALDAAMKMLENAGNAYDLHKLIMDEGLLCPILFKNYAVYCVRGTFSDVTAGPYNVFYKAPEAAPAEE